MRFILSYMKKFKGPVFLAMLLKLVATFLELTLPFILEHLIDDVAPLGDWRQIIYWGLLMIVLAFAARNTGVWANRRAVKTASSCIYLIRKDLFKKTINLTGDQIDEITIPSLTSRMTSDSYNLQSFIQTSQTLGARAPILLLGGFIFTFIMDRGLSMVLGIMLPFLITLVIIISIKGIPLHSRVQTKLDNVLRVMRENITGIRVIKALNKEKREQERFNEKNKEMMDSDLKASIVMSLPGPTVTFFMNIGLCLVILYGAYRVNNGVTKPGVILAFLTYFQLIMNGVMGFNRIFLLTSKANASAERIKSVIDKEEREKLSVLDKIETDDQIVFDSVSFSYGESDETDSSSFNGESRIEAISNISFRVKKGSTLGIIGATGSGKTTLINLLLKFYSPQKGKIFLDGINIENYDKKELRQKFGTVFQSDVVFHDTIKNNVKFRRDLSDEDIDKALSDSLSDEYIKNYDDALNHEVAIKGANLSGGQKQRLMIARALAGNPEIVILDDSSSALDYKTDAELRKNIRQHHQNQTLIVIAQRISSVKDLDNILVLSDGRLIGQGRHEELLKTNKEYKEIYLTQMGEN